MPQLTLCESCEFENTKILFLNSMTWWGRNTPGRNTKFVEENFDLKNFSLITVGEPYFDGLLIIVSVGTRKDFFNGNFRYQIENSLNFSSF